MEIRKTNNNCNLSLLLSINQKLNKFVSLFNWLDTKLEESIDDRIRQSHLHNYAIANYFKYFDFKDFNFIKLEMLLKNCFTFSIKEQGYNFEQIYYQNVKFRH